ncbi:hypothetical protein PFUGPA_00361 [Plasmodium falciparum Palo Alto/Uganda]|uniref:Uncharacterized protein n=3 Tax=Plasmodium falciparum TaxID=5833 RepID=W4J5V1_PLAFP|nr:hypothetical protein PFFVO_00353 [Plasmodium falciparum Vietnam Oak-Knoll (FVO)]ETW51632.1 hypothetical protein PFMALIP_00364 [Plasmodium falciparum MaliPS096_E11]ETW57668.1 hypothetical protein PFUGPA_00361 [Plasmodium falciparum Palo Alto/Uganda]
MSRTKLHNRKNILDCIEKNRKIFNNKKKNYEIILSFYISLNLYNIKYIFFNKCRNKFFYY